LEKFQKFPKFPPFFFQENDNFFWEKKLTSAVALGFVFFFFLAKFTLLGQFDSQNG